MAETKEDLVYMAKLAEQADRYEDVVEYMTRATQCNPELDKEQRNLLSVGYKNVVGVKRVAWRALSTAKERAKPSEAEYKMDKYRQEIEQELKTVCGEALELLDDHLITSAPDDEAKVFYDKMVGDYYRYIAEITTADEQKAAADKSFAAYKKAWSAAEQNLDPNDPVLLGLALNFSVFYKEIMNESEKAVALSKQAYDGAMAGLDSLGEETYKDSTVIMQLLRDNITLWTEEEEAAC